MIGKIKDIISHKLKLYDKNDPYEAYNSSRFIGNKKYVCHAPFNNMYFNSAGDVAMCWLTFNEPERYSEENGIKKIWFGEKFTKIRESIKQQNLEYKCNTCKKYIEEGNHVNVLAKAYDIDYPNSEYPSIMEFELSNTCNLECTMCSGMLSSAIRKNREGLPALKSPYGEKFVEELKEFIPYLKEARFNGGEPFLIKIYYQIWDLIMEINPSIKITIATNGTVLNQRVKDYLLKGNFHLNISMDGFSKETYEKIRINGDHDQLMKNFEWFKDYCSSNNRNLCIMINPMRHNWWEMPDFVNWCNHNHVHLWFNTIVRPEDQAIWNLTSPQLEEIYQTLSKAKILPRGSTIQNLYSYNLETYKNLVHQQIKTWWKEAVERENSSKKSTIQFTDIESLLTEVLPRLNDSKSFTDFLNELNVDDRQKVELSLLLVNADYIVNELNTKSIDQIKAEVEQFVLKS